MANPITHGTAGNDIINGGGSGKASDGVLYAPGPDFNGAAGAVRLYGEAGNDSLYGTAHCDTLVGGAGGDLLRGGLGCDQLYGDGGAVGVVASSDTFIFKAGELGTKFAAGTTLTAASFDTTTCGDMIMDFGGAGGYAATNNDFIAFQGFGAGASVAKLGVCTFYAPADVYKVTYGDGGMSLFTLVSLNHNALGNGDYGFYA